ncbi:MAG: extracellular solute-binding protein, partial [Anaerolineae bacterium]|nr:extracellular solute-binding protein [Anaerolineae bacterium]
MKKLAVLSTLLSVLALGLAPAAAQNQQIVMWAQYDLADANDRNAVTLSAKIAEFEAETGIKVVYEQVAWNQLATKLAVAVQSGGDVPDLVEASSQHIPSLLNAGALMPLDELLADSAFVAELGEGDANACVYDGIRYCVATNVRGGITYYKADAFPNGFPATKDEWLAAAAEVEEGKFLSTQFAGRSYGAIEIAWWPMIASNGGAIFDEEGKPAWATEEVAEVVEFARALYGSNAMPIVNVTGDFSDAEAPWISGISDSFRGGSWSAIFVPGLQEA